jgi:hypothetical protein
MLRAMAVIDPLKALLPPVIVVVCVLTSASARAECVRVTAKDVQEAERYELVFSGTVVEITRTAELGYRASFEVERVWKGSVTKRFDLYVWELDPEIPRFIVGRHYLALAKKLVSAPARRGAGLGDSNTLAFTPVQCSDPDSLAPNIIRDLGPGQPPHNPERLRRPSLGHPNPLENWLVT